MRLAPALLITVLILAARPALAAWGADETAASHVLETSAAVLSAEPRHGANPGRLVPIFEAAGWVSLLDGDSLQVRGRFQPVFTPRGRPSYSPDGRFLFLHSADGWVGKYDLFSFKPVARIRVAEKLRGIAVSSNGKWLLAANARPNTLTVLHAGGLGLFKIINVAGSDGSALEVAAVHDAGPRQSFIVAMQDAREVWELSYDPEAAPVYGNFVHSYRAGQVEGVVVEEQPFARRRLVLAERLTGFFFDPAYAEVIAGVLGGGAVYNLDARRRVTRLDLAGAPRFTKATSWAYGDRWVMAVPDARQASIDIVDMENWQSLQRLETGGLADAVISHRNAPYAWGAVAGGANKGKLHVIDKRTLQIIKTVVPGKAGANVQAAFTRDGRYLLAAVADANGALVIYDALSLEEVKRLPMAMPRLR
jgi:hypothetical protein